MDNRREPSIHCKVYIAPKLATAALCSSSPRLLAKYLLGTGVMRFLQTEWHRHERERNAWQIERAEMKSRIGKLEGDGRTSKRLQESLGKHVKILENALKRERENVKRLQSSQNSEEKETVESDQPKPKASLKRRKPQSHYLLDTDGLQPNPPNSETPFWTLRMTHPDLRS